jgi:hypothetical protein
MTTAHEILTSNAAAQIAAGAVEVTTLQRAGRQVGAILTTSDGNRLLMEDRPGEDGAPRWAWVAWADGVTSGNQVTDDVATAQEVAYEWVADVVPARSDIR